MMKKLYSEDVLENTNEEFSIGQLYDDHGAYKQICQKCGGDKFEVGIGSYYTAVRCPTCLWEVCVHDG